MEIKISFQATLSTSVLTLQQLVQAAGLTMPQGADAISVKTRSGSFNWTSGDSEAPAVGKGNVVSGEMFKSGFANLPNFKFIRNGGTNCVAYFNIGLSSLPRS